MIVAVAAVFSSRTQLLDWICEMYVLPEPTKDLLIGIGNIHYLY